MGIGWLLKQIAELFGTVGVTLGVDRMLKSGVGGELEKSWEQFKTRIEQQAQYRVVVRDYIRNKVEDPERTALQKRHTDAVAAGNLLYANRIESVYVLVYLTFEDTNLGPEEERSQARARAFKELGLKALETDSVAFDTLLEFYEQRAFRTYLLVGKQLGIDAWQFLGRSLSTIIELVGGEGATETVKAYLQNPHQWGVDFSAHRMAVQEWAWRKTIEMHEANATSKEATAMHPPDRGVYYVIGMVIIVIIIALIFGRFI